MFEHDRSDAETAELVKEWLSRHLPVILAGIVIALLIIFAMRWWEKREIAAAHQLSYQLERLETAVASQDDAAVKQAYNEALIKDSGNYGAFAALLMAQHHQHKGQSKEAQPLLEKAANAKDALLAQTAQWQLLQLKLAAADYDGAEALANKLNGSIYAPQLPLLRGDILYLRGDYAAALSQYQQSQTLQASPIVEMRVRQLQAQLALQPSK